MNSKELLKIPEVKKRINLKKDFIFFGLDEFEFTLEDLEKDCFIIDDDTSLPPIYNLDYDNTPSAYISFIWMNFKYSRISPRGYKYWLKFTTIIDFGDSSFDVDCFALVKWRENNSLTSKDKVVIYSSFFLLQYLKKIPFSICEFTKICFSENINSHRFDIALDLPYTVKMIKKKILKWVNFHTTIWFDDKHPEFAQTYYIKNPRSDKNRKYIFRVYDKIKDTFIKKKAFLYPHLLNNPDVRRIELELRPEECKRIIDYSVYDILENKDNCVFNIFFTYFSPFSKYKINFKNLNYIPYSNINIDLWQAYLHFNHIPNDYLCRAYWYINNIKTNTWYNWLFQVLFKEQINLDWTIKETKFYLESFSFLENLLNFMISKNCNPYILNKILKKFITNKVKLWKKK